MSYGFSTGIGYPNHKLTIHCKTLSDNYDVVDGSGKVLASYKTFKGARDYRERLHVEALRKQAQKKRQRQIFPSSEIPHLWMHQVQEEARNSNGTLYFSGPTIYSYGSHFPISRHVANKHGKKAILFTTASYSVTTSGHCSAVRSAIPSGTPVFNVPSVETSWGGDPSHRKNLESYVTRATQALEKAARARKQYSVNGYYREAIATRDEAIRYAEFFCLKAPKFPKFPAKHKLDNLRRELAALAAQRAAEARKREQEAQRRRLEEAREQIERFRAGDPTTRTVYGIPPMLRIVGDEVQTSLGASFPIEHARLGLRAVRKVRATGEEYRRNGHTIHLGHYAIDRIEPNGTVHAGCHVVKWDEIELIAPQLDPSVALQA